MSTILDGKKIADKIKAGIKEKIDTLEQKPGLAVVLAGKDPASLMYVSRKERACNEAGIHSERHQLPESTTEEKLLQLIDKLNSNDKIHSILVQLPLPKHIDKNAVMESIAVEKDVDGFTSFNTGMLALGNEKTVPCTPKGIIRLLEEYKIQVSGSNAVVIGRSAIVGRPIFIMLINRNATVTVCHSRTKNLSEITKRADIIVAAVGKPNLIKADMLKEGCTVIDVGINRVNGKIIGDVDFESASTKAKYITPVPGGVGPMTVAMLLENTLECYRRIEN